MKMKIFAVIAALCAVSIGQSAFAEGTNDVTTELKGLVSQIQQKIQAGQRSAADLAPELKQFDTLLAEHKGEKTDGVAQVLFMKAQLYGQVFDDKKTADTLMEQLKKDYKDTKFVNKLMQREEAGKAAEKLRSQLAAGSPFPEFNEKDIDGNPLSVASHKGKVLLIDFWATWCPPCRAEIPNVVSVYKKYHAQGFDIIGVSLDEDKDKVTEFIKQHEMTWPQYFDGEGWSNKLAVKYGIESIPSTFLVDGNGKIIATDVRGDELETAVAKAVAAK